MHENESQTLKKRGIESASQTSQNRIKSTEMVTQTPKIVLKDRV